MLIKKRGNKLQTTVDSQADQSVRPITISELVDLNQDPKFLDALEVARKADPELQSGETAITSLYRRNTQAAHQAEREACRMSSLIGLDGRRLTY